MSFEVNENGGMLEIVKDDAKWTVPSLTKIPYRKYQALQKRLMSAEDADQEAVDAIGEMIDESAPGMLDALELGEAMTVIGLFSAGLGA